jgi:carboxyl-terminal processing protease
MTDREEVIFNEAIENDFKTLLLDIEKSKVTALEDYQKEIQQKLEDEIVKRYFYREGLYDYQLNNDEAILAATGLLGDEGKYYGLLK